MGKGYNSPETPGCAFLIRLAAVHGKYHWLHTGNDWVNAIYVMLQNLLHWESIPEQKWEFIAHWKLWSTSMDFNESVNTFSNIIWLQVKSSVQAWGITLQCRVNENCRKCYILFSHPCFPRMRHYKILRTTFKINFLSQIIKRNLIAPRVSVSCVKVWGKKKPDSFSSQFTNRSLHQTVDYSVKFFERTRIPTKSLIYLPERYSWA